MLYKFPAYFQHFSRGSVKIYKSTGFAIKDIQDRVSTLEKVESIHKSAKKCEKDNSIASQTL